MREKLIELLREAQYLGGLEEKIADHLIDNGVTIPVRCKDCKQYDYVVYDYGRCRKCCLLMKNDDFCSYGERRTDV